jgi:hypothetical protein
VPHTAPPHPYYYYITVRFPLWRHLILSYRGCMEFSASAVMAAPAPAHLYLRVEGGLSWVYCDRDTSFALVDALALLRPRSVRAAGRAPNAAQRARQHAAFEKDIMEGHARLAPLAPHHPRVARGRRGSRPTVPPPW